MARTRSLGLSGRLALASAGTALAIGSVCAVGMFSIDNIWRTARVSVSRHLELLDDAAAFGSLLYQKGFAAEYMLTHDRQWLEQLESSRRPFEHWLSEARWSANTPDERLLLDDVQREYAAYNTGRNNAIATFDRGEVEEAIRVLAGSHAHLERLLALFSRASQIGRRDLERQLAAAASSVQRLARMLVATGVVGGLASLLVGFWWARRITRPIYELRVLVELAAERTRIQVRPASHGDLESLGEQVSALVQKLEDTDAALAEHRRRLIQSEKLSAVGELSAKLAHEVLNPLAGMKAAVQLLVRPNHPAAHAALVETAEALNREISRVEGLVRRLTNYSRPLAPRIESSTVPVLLDAATDAAQPAFVRHDVRLVRDVSPDVPPLEIDLLLMTQALSNLLVNAAEMSPAGSTVELSATRAVSLGKPEVVIQVADQGPGVAVANQGKLFQPFFTTKPNGHGLGLAVSQNILAEHGGRITAEARPSPHRGAIFSVHIPVSGGQV